jgi:hypothetical protein
MEYALLQMGQEGPAKQLRDDSNVSFALSALTVANDCPKHTFSFRIARLQAQKAIDLYFEEVESSLNGI